MSARLLLLFASSKTIAPPTNLNLTTTGVKDIGTQTGSGVFSTWFIQMLCPEITDFVSAPVVSIGTNAPYYNNIYSPLPFDADIFSSDGENIFQNIEISNGNAIAPGAAIKANVTIAAVASVYTANISLSGIVQ